MNSLAIVYIEKHEDLEQLKHTKGFMDTAVKYRTAIYFPSENENFEKRLADKDFNYTSISMGLIKAHECTNPHLSSLNEFDLETSFVPIMAEVQPYWIGDVDVWFNFSIDIENKVKRIFPNVFFGTIENHV